MKRRNWALFFAAFAMGILILDSRNAVDAAAEGVDICIKTVIPSLFPFFVLSIFLTGSLGNTGIFRPISRLFRVGKGAEGTLISGLLGGYPVGAQSAAEAFRSGRVSAQTASRLIMFCSQAGPSFLFGMVASQFPERKYGWMLWAVQLLSAWSVSQMIPISVEPNTNSATIKRITITDAMKRAVSAIASVCGWVIIFRVFLYFLDQRVLWFLPDVFRILISGLLELTNGCLMLNEISNISIRFILTAIMLNFGGICVLMQTASVTQGLNLKYYILGKLTQTCLAPLYCLCFLGKIEALIPIAGIFLLSYRVNLRKNSSIPAAIGV